MISQENLRRQGIRLTPQRHLILNAIAHGQGHMTAEEIYERIRPAYPEISISTVYRNLERLCDLRLVAVTDLGGGHVRYEVVGSAPHHHLICHRCGSIVELHDNLVADLRASILRQYDFSVEADHLALWGLCSKCSQESKTVQGV